jgi:hypothetical protein
MYVLYMWHLFFKTIFNVKGLQKDSKNTLRQQRGEFYAHA